GAHAALAPRARRQRRGKRMPPSIRQSGNLFPLRRPPGTKTRRLAGWHAVCSCTPEFPRIALMDRIFGIHASALLLRSQRMDVLATNLANADTPHYKARDFDFASALDRAMGQGGLGDRKSTRLSSSHVKIAYADFSL